MIPALIVASGVKFDTQPVGKQKPHCRPFHRDGATLPVDPIRQLISACRIGRARHHHRDPPIRRHPLQALQSHHPFAGVFEKFDTKSLSISPDDLPPALVVFFFGIRQRHGNDLSERRDYRRLDAKAAAAVVDQIAFIQVIRSSIKNVPGKQMPEIFSPVEVATVVRLQHSQLLSWWLVIY
jgi:hypothetical protein